MKQRILIFCTAFFTISLTAFGYIKWKNADPIIQTLPTGGNLEDTPSNPPADFEFVYSVDTRFMATITKEELEKARSITDIITPKDDESIASFHNIEISTFHEDRKMEFKEKSENEVLTGAQIRILRSLGYPISFNIGGLDYPASFYVTGSVKKRDAFSGKLVVDTLISYMTVVPHQPAAYKEGKEALTTYLKENSREAIAIARKDHLRPGKISFLVTREGGIDQVRLTYTSGYPSIDEKMLELIREVPGSWEAGTNAKGEKVDQELVFFFGLIGC